MAPTLTSRSRGGGRRGHGSETNSVSVITGTARTPRDTFSYRDGAIDPEWKRRSAIMTDRSRGRSRGLPWAAQKAPSLRSGQTLMREGSLGHWPSTAHDPIGDARYPSIEPEQDGAGCSNGLERQW